MKRSKKGDGSIKNNKKEEQLTPQVISGEPPEEKPYPASEAGRLLGFSTHTLYRWIQRGWMEATPLPNGRYVVTAKEIERLRKLISGESLRDLISEITVLPQIRESILGTRSKQDE